MDSSGRPLVGRYTPNHWVSHAAVFKAFSVARQTAFLSKYGDDGLSADIEIYSDDGSVGGLPSDLFDGYCSREYAVSMGFIRIFMDSSRGIGVIETGDTITVRQLDALYDYEETVLRHWEIFQSVDVEFGIKPSGNTFKTGFYTEYRTSSEFKLKFINDLKSHVVVRKLLHETEPADGGNAGKLAKLNARMKKDIVKFSYRKKSGAVRKASGTLNPDKMPKPK